MTSRSTTTAADLTDDEISAASPDELRAAYRELRDRQSQLIAAALRVLKADGRKTGGDVPYGSQLDEDGTTLRDHPDEQRVMQLARGWRHEGWTLQAIATKLRKLGFRPRATVNGRRRREFHLKQISRMVNTPPPTV